MHIYQPQFRSHGITADNHLQIVVLRCQSTLHVLRLENKQGCICVPGLQCCLIAEVVTSQSVY